MTLGVSVTSAAYRTRWERVWHEMRGDDVGVLVVHGFGVNGAYGNVSYLTGHFPSPKGAVVVMPEGSPPVLLASSTEAARGMEDDLSEDVDVCVPEEGASVAELAVSLASEAKGSARVGTVEVEEFGLPSHLNEALGSAFRRSKLVSFGPKISSLRRHTTPEDFKGMSAAMSVAEGAIDAFEDSFRLGMSECEGSATIQRYLAENMTRYSIVRVTVGSSCDRPASDRQAQRGDLVSAVVELVTPSGYWVELGALYAVGGQTRLMAEAKIAAEHAIAANRLGCDAMRGGKRVASAAAAMAADLDDRGSAYVDGLGHGVGIDEGAPVLGRDYPGVLQKGEFVAVHPTYARIGFSMSTQVINTVAVGESGGEPLSTRPWRIGELAG